MSGLTFDQAQIRTVLAGVKADLQDARIRFERGLDPWEEAQVEWLLVGAYNKLSILAEGLGLLETRRTIVATLEAAMADGITRLDRDPDGDAHLKWSSGAYAFANALAETLLRSSPGQVTTEIEAILRQCTYSIGDQSVFGSAPACELDVHRRIEAILKPIFPDLIHQPTLSKPIKSFRPDTGVRSARTLLEFKFINALEQVKTVADEILADSRGYVSVEWPHLIYVIYETRRFRAEAAWEQLLRACDVPESVRLIVLTGEAQAPNNGIE